MLSIHYNILQVLSKPISEQECKKAHEPFALHKKIRSKECPLSGEILAMEERFKRYKPQTLKWLTSNSLICF